MTSHAARSQVAQIATQIGSSLDPDTDQYINRFLVKSTSSSSLHRVSQKRSDGTWCCSCRGWTMHVDAQGRRKCRHLTDILARLAGVAAEAQVALDKEVVAMLKSARTAYLDLGGTAKPTKRRATAGRQLDL
jgi:hypothetical protein